MKSLASFKTERACKYLKALCVHFGRKVDAQYENETGWVQFPFGRCEFKADGGTLEFCASADDRRQLDKVTNIITSHFERFAFRENPKLDWRTLSQFSELA